ncbi:MAG: DUF2254 domain-containing protein [Xanthobacteraceae bacterium]|nr:DUF2254 domain-containing protein [Xanthobacteraceae bacterium]
MSEVRYVRQHDGVQLIGLTVGLLVKIRRRIVSCTRLIRQKARAAWRTSKARLWRLLFHLIFYIRNVASNYASRALSAIAAVLLIGSYFSIAPLNDTLSEYFTNVDALSAFRTLLVTLGGAIIGATAIVFSLITFAVQINVDRTSHRLFRRLSTDRRLFSAFIATFLFAVAVASLSVIVEPQNSAVVLWGAIWSTIAILSLFIYAFMRTLSLISPINQLNIIVGAVKKEFVAWDRRVRKLAPLLPIKKQMLDKSGIDDARFYFLQSNSSWTQGAGRAISDLIGFSRRYAQSGDYSVADAALNAILAVHEIYVRTKGRTFFAHNAVIDDPFVSDDFITNTLEYLKQNIALENSRKDEVMLRQNFQALSSLSQLYLNIEYGSPFASKSHAHLAAGYLSDAVKSSGVLQNADVLMGGLRLMGQTARYFLSRAKPSECVTLIKEIASISLVGAFSERLLPVTLIGLEQLSALTQLLLVLKDKDTHYAIKELDSYTELVVTSVLSKVSDDPLRRNHSTYLGPIYSSLSDSALPQALSRIVNDLADRDDASLSKAFALHLEEWSEATVRNQKKVFQTAIKASSSAIYDIVHWISTVTKVLLATSRLKGVDEFNGEDLRKSALWIIMVLSWVPRDKESIGAVENANLTEVFFDNLIDAKFRDCDVIASEISILLLTWTLEGGKYGGSYAILQRGFLSLCVAALWKTDTSADLKALIHKKLIAEDVMDKEDRVDVARYLRKRSLEPRADYSYSKTDGIIEDVDQNRLSDLLVEVADIISPETKGEKIEHDPFFSGDF